MTMDLGSSWNMAFAVLIIKFSRRPSHDPMAIGKESLNGSANENLCPKFENSPLLNRNPVLYIATQP